MFKLLRYIFLTFFATSVSAVLVLRYVPIYITPLMIIRCVQQKASGQPVRLMHHWVPLSHMSPYLPVAVMASEDQRFLQHHGFDFEQIKEAATERLTGRRLRGGSTISQQTAKNVFLWPQSSWVRKGFEAYFTLLIELFWSKQRIMEVYLNSIEMGPGIYGAHAVARAHFSCTPDELTRADCALIAATLPNPLQFSSLHPSRYMRRRQHQIMRQMRHISLLPAPARPWAVPSPKPPSKQQSSSSSRVSLTQPICPIR